MIGIRNASDAGLCLAASLSALASAAGAWEFQYGPPGTFEEAQRRVTPVVSCSGGGFIAIGTQNLSGFADPDVYVVRTDNAGFPLWERTYDIQSLGLTNEGMALAEDPAGGWVLLANTWDGAWYPSLTRIDCNGDPQWTQGYRDFQGGDILGRDLIRTRSGDWAVAGIAGHGSGEDGFMMRTAANGSLLWNNSYDAGGQEAFNALTEADATSSLPADLVAVGRFIRPGESLQGLVARVNGASGGFTSAVHCMNHHGNRDRSEIYNSVIQLSIAGNGIAIAGTSTPAGGWMSDIWVVTSATGCVPASQSLFGSPAASEEAYDLREVRVARTGIPAGSLAVAGSHQSSSSASDAAILFVGIGPPLQPLGGALFGDFGFAAETFHSLAESPAGGSQPGGFILAGSTEAGDPRDLYLVHYDPAVQGCQQRWEPESQRTNEAHKKLNKNMRSPALERPVAVEVGGEKNDSRICK